MTVGGEPVSPALLRTSRVAEVSMLLFSLPVFVATFFVSTVGDRWWIPALPAFAAFFVSVAMRRRLDRVVGNTEQRRTALADAGRVAPPLLYWSLFAVGVLVMLSGAWYWLVHVERDGDLFFERIPLGDRVLITAADYPLPA